MTVRALIDAIPQWYPLAAVVTLFVGYWIAKFAIVWVDYRLWLWRHSRAHRARMAEALREFERRRRSCPDSGKL